MITYVPFAKENVYLFSLKNEFLELEITNYGGIIKSIKIDGIDICLGFDTLEEYEKNTDYLGAIVGRHANRIKNSTFTLNNENYILSNNENNNQLHGGIEGFNRKIWDYEISDDCLKLHYFSKDGEEGFPGNLDVYVSYTLKETSLIIEYYAKSDKDTIVNLTNHTYFNLGGHDSGTILNHNLKLNADCYTPIDENLIPTGEIASVFQTPFDFTVEKKIGKDIEKAKGYDHNFVLNNPNAAYLSSDETGIAMETYTTNCGIQIYTSNMLNTVGKNNTAYKTHSAICLETQFFPDAINQPSFPSPVLKANEEYNHTTIYKFSKITK